MAGILKDKSPEEIRDLLGLEVILLNWLIWWQKWFKKFKDDLTEEEKEAIRQKNVWCQYWVL
jgi:hypothetical protein